MSEGRQREATHAGSWYSDNGAELDRQLEGWLGAVTPSLYPARAIIAPHAGFRYSGAVSAHAFRQVAPAHVRHVFVLGPSHHVRLGGCAVSGLSSLATPLGSLAVDRAVCDALRATGHFSTMSAATDEDEHSIEMMLPFVAKVMQGHRDRVTVIPILVGSLSYDKESLYGSLLAPYLRDPNTLFVISSDFCHWGDRFRYSPGADQTELPIHEYISRLDHEGMSLIEQQSPSAFSDYLRKTHNTICGRHPIGVLLHCLSHLKQGPSPPTLSLRFLQYAQSSAVTRPNDSSVSYAAAALTLQ